MTLLRRLAASLVALSVVLAGLAAFSPAAEASTASSFEALTNSARAAAGLAPYAVMGDLSAVALGQAERMAAAQKLFHNPQLATDVKGWSYVGENVGYGPDVATLQSAFMHSPDHRANILDRDFTQVGVGAVTVNGTVWVSVVFRRPLHVTGTTSKAPAHRTTAAKPVTHFLSGIPAGAHASAGPRIAPILPAGVRCLANALMARQIMALAQGAHTVRLVVQSQRTLIGYQCGKGLPLTGLLDLATLHALHG